MSEMMKVRRLKVMEWDVRRKEGRVGKRGREGGG